MFLEEKKTPNGPQSKLFSYFKYIQMYFDNLTSLRFYTSKDADYR